MLKHRIDKALKGVNKPASDLITFIDMTPTGYYAMLRNDDIKVSILKKIAVFTKQPINFFTDETEPKPDSVVNEPTGSKAELELLYGRVKDLERIRDFQDEEIKELKTKLKKQENIKA